MPTDVRQTESYWSPTQIKCYAVVEDGAVWIDDAVGIDLRVEDQRLPHYGYRDTFFREVSYGKSLISGNLYIAFRQPNYLSDAIQHAGLQNENPLSITARGDPIYESTQAKPSGTDGDYETFNVDLLVKAIQGDIKKYQFYADDFKRAFLNDNAQGNNSRFGDTSRFTTTSNIRKQINKNRAAEVQRLTGRLLNVQIRYGDHTYQESPSFTKTVEGIVFNSESHTISMLDGSGDQMLLEVYGFFARSISSY